MWNIPSIYTFNFHVVCTVIRVLVLLLLIVFIIIVCCILVPGPEGVAPDGGYSSMMIMMMGWLVFATALFLLRPNSLRSQGTEKPAPDQGVSVNVKLVKLKV